ncbi:hypothetical protein [Catenulispora subtropica]|uniref:Ankyrin n=1 Tax=Catenulispora subtropica TaxID=450798 RepID=A0ABN2S779_9ACTN
MNHVATTLPSARLESFRGDFEIHVTVPAKDAELDRLAAWAARRAVKFTHIVLARGSMPSQPMLTIRVSGMLDAICSRAESMTADLLNEGFTVSRVKVEAAPYATGVPATNAEAAGSSDGMYFEHHVKLLLEPAYDEAALAASVISHGAHLSRNARRLRDDGRAERFVTQRCRGVGRVEAGERLEALTGVLVDVGLDVVSVEREYVVYDSAPAVDAGWIDEECVRS